MGLIRILLIAMGAVLAYSLYRRYLHRGGGSGADTVEDERLGRLVQDPQCNIYVDGKDAVKRSVPGGELFFCSEECAEEFLREGSGKEKEGE